ncbi:MAG TPA: chemotaxis protein CheA [Pyrinomonadaceae bacterium]|jgi:two-component system chemotaxis sensor kinase CheA
MPENEFNAQFFEQFLDDYFAESDEHLRSVRRNLLALEDSLAANRAIEKNVVGELFRSFHTLKGISAMANVSAAETLAHYMESYLRLLRDGQTAFTEKGLNALIKSTKKLEEIVAARRDGGEIPPIEIEIKLLESLTIDGEIVESRPPSEIESIASQNLRADKSLYLFTFLSSAELAERGVNVNSVRERLQAIGTIQKSTPAVKEGGKIAFEFVVETGSDESVFAAWQSDGINFEKIETEARETAVARESKISESQKSGLFGQSNVVRVDLARLDELMLMVGELVISRAKLAEQIRQIENLLPSGEWRSLQELNHAIERQLRNLRDGVMRVRMIPIGEIFERMQFAVRDLARETGKRIRLEITGENTEIDKLLVERMLDPLLHLVRNAVSHGIEDAAAREAKGKSPEGKIRLHAETIGETVEIEIMDDGRGIDRKEVAKRARTRGLLNADENLDESGLLEILCSPGFSTREEADKTSGRGVGMDVVRRTVDELGGEIKLETETDRGTKFRIQLPLTLAIADALIVAAGRERFAVPQSNVREVIEIETGALRQFENNEVIEYRGAALPIVRLARVFALEEKARGAFHAFVVGEGKQAVGIAVDRIIGQSEIVIRAINDRLAQTPGISGATELGDGRVVLILDVSAITRRLKQKI